MNLERQSKLENLYMYCGRHGLTLGGHNIQAKAPAYALDITFQNGIVEMSFFRFPYTKTTFLDIVALEQSSVENEFLPFSSYVALMENIVKTTEGCRHSTPVVRH